MLKKCLGPAWILMLLLGGCQTDPNTKKSAQELYDKAHKSFQAKKFKTALEAFEELERQHPYADLSGQALLMAGECGLKSKQYMRGADSLDMFIRMHPTSQQIEKALYLRALCYYENRAGLLRDMSAANNALQAFNEFLNRFPKGVYAQEVEDKKRNLLEFFSQKDIRVARFYKVQKNFSAALHHLSLVDQRGQNHIFHPEALYEIVDCFHSLGMNLAAQRMCMRMQAVYPKDSWTQKAVEQCRKKTSIAQGQKKG